MRFVVKNISKVLLSLPLVNATNNSIAVYLPSINIIFFIFIKYDIYTHFSINLKKCLINRTLDYYLSIFRILSNKNRISKVKIL